MAARVQPLWRSVAGLVPEFVSPNVLSLCGLLCLVQATFVCMSYSAFLLRANVSATMFTVVGIMCKIGTVVINQVIWDKHASANGLAALLVCLLAGTFYKQAPRRGERAGGK